MDDAPFAAGDFIYLCLTGPDKSHCCSTEHQPDQQASPRGECRSRAAEWSDIYSCCTAKGGMSLVLMRREGELGALCVILSQFAVAQGFKYLLAGGVGQDLSPIHRHQSVHQFPHGHFVCDQNQGLLGALTFESGSQASFGGIVHGTGGLIEQLNRSVLLTARVPGPGFAAAHQTVIVSFSRWHGQSIGVSV